MKIIKIAQIHKQAGLADWVAEQSLKIAPTYIALAKRYGNARVKDASEISAENMVLFFKEFPKVDAGVISESLSKNLNKFTWKVEGYLDPEHKITLDETDLPIYEQSMRESFDSEVLFYVRNLLAIFQQTLEKSNWGSYVEEAGFHGPKRNVPVKEDYVLYYQAAFNLFEKCGLFAR